MKKDTAKNLIASLLALTIVCATLASCMSGGNGNETGGITSGSDSGNVTAGDSASEEVTTADYDYKQDLPEGSFDGADVVFAYVREEYTPSFTADSDASDQFAYSLYKRNKTIEDKYDIILEFMTSPGGDHGSMYTLIAEATLDDSGPIDIAAVYHSYGSALWGTFLNLNEFDVLQFDKPYWVQGWNEMSEYNGTMYTCTSFIDCIGNIGGAEVIFVNDRLAEDNQISVSGLYDAVDEHRWTLDVLYENMCKYGSSIDDTWGFEDTYGLAYNGWGGRGLLASAGMNLASYDGEEVTFTLISERNVDIFNKVYDILNKDNHAYRWPQNNGLGGSYEAADGDLPVFCENRALFYCTGLGRMQDIAGYIDKYSVLPCPLYDENQEDYITTILGPSVFSIVKSSKDPECAATILEAMSILSYEDCREAYYEIMLKNRYSSLEADDRLFQTMDMIISNIKVDFLLVHSNSFSSVTYKPYDWIAEKNFNYVSKMGSLQEALQANLEAFEREFKEISEN